MRTETYTDAERRADTLLESILVRPHTESEVAKAIAAGNIWRALSNGEGWDPVAKNPIGYDGLSWTEVPTTIPIDTRRRGSDLIREERDRQINEEGWSREHDAGHTRSELALAGAAYALHAAGEAEAAARAWPWDAVWWKPGVPLQDLIKAGALIAAEIDRLGGGVA